MADEHTALLNGYLAGERAYQLASDFEIRPTHRRDSAQEHRPQPKSQPGADDTPLAFVPRR
jgi:hypothetical protein